MAVAIFIIVIKNIDWVDKPWRLMLRKTRQKAPSKPQNTDFKNRSHKKKVKEKNKTKQQQKYTKEAKQKKTRKSMR